MNFLCSKFYCLTGLDRGKYSFSKRTLCFPSSLFLALFGSLLAFIAPQDGNTQTKNFARIINGAPAGPSEYPFVVSLYPKSSTPSLGHFCGGTLISSTVVVSAAHCVARYRSTPDQLGVYLGSSSLIGEGVSPQVVEVIIHPDYSSTTSQNDLAIIRLGEPIAISPIKVTDLEGEQEFARGLRGSVVGWGLTKVASPGNGDRPTDLQKGEIPYISPTECASVYGPEFDSRTMFCAGKRPSTPGGPDFIDSCFGDSGGPLFVEGPNGVRLVGVVSWGGEKCDGAGVYARLIPHLEWLRSFGATVDEVPVEEEPVSLQVDISGTPKVGSILTCAYALLTGTIKGEVKYRWTAGRVKTSYNLSPLVRLTEETVGLPVQCHLLVTQEGGESLRFSSRKTRRVASRTPRGPTPSRRPSSKPEVQPPSRNPSRPVVAPISPSTGSGGSRVGRL
jgi:trypsin